MKKTLLLLLIISLATAEQGITQNHLDSFIYTSQNQVTFKLLNKHPQHNMYNTKVTFTPPQGVSLRDNATQSALLIDSSIGTHDFVWDISTQLSREELNKTIQKESFVLDWDKESKIQFLKIKTSEGETILQEKKKVSTQNKKVKITGKTEKTSFCDNAFQETGKQVFDKKTHPENCYTQVRITTKNGNKITEWEEATSNGDFELEIGFSGENMFQDNKYLVTARDPGGNTQSQNITISYNPSITDIIIEYLWVVILLVLLFFAAVILAVIAYIIYGKRRKQVEKIKTYQQKLDRRRKLIDEIQRLEKKRINLRLSEAEKKRKKTYELELEQIQEDLLHDKEHLKRLYKRTNKVVEQSKEGVPSQKIKQQLIDEGYTKKEIEIIKRLFQKRKSQIKAREKLGLDQQKEETRTD